MLSSDSLDSACFSLGLFGSITLNVASEAALYPTGSASRQIFLYLCGTLAFLAIAGLGVQVLWLWELYPDARLLKPCAEGFSPRFRLVKPLFVKTAAIGFGLLIAFVSGQRQFYLI